jgi:chromosome partitioning protein
LFQNIIERSILLSAQITAITNQKGGVGKTTTAVNLGVALAKEGQRVLLVDGDPQGSLTISMGIQDPDSLTETLSTLMLAEMEDKQIPPDYGILHHSEGVDLLPGNIELSGVELSLVNTMSRELVLRNVLNRLRNNYDYIFIDCMPSLGLMNINALAAADSVIIPLQPQFLSTKGLNLLLRSIARVRKQINSKLRIDGILFTMVDSRANNARDIISSLRSAVGDNIRVFKTEIPRSVRAAEAAENGKSIFKHDRRGKVAEAYTALSKEVNGIGREAYRSRSDGAR